MLFELSQSFTFDAAHTLTRTVPLVEYQSSKRIHGHTYTAEVVIRGLPGASGMLEIKQDGKKKPVVVDLFVLKGAIEKVRSKLDHHFLDEVEGLGAATLENLCVFIANEIGAHLPVGSVVVSRHAGDKCRLSLC
ncbi:6-carboxytetrahydropterin synthase [Bradyrhizobium sp. 62]|nr:6-carboxytetrahydropterin synthase [Bradyrhizobium sp. 62]MCK1367799.1 6-carboxytetrahydropterin synthase [Bradyrhizobium sp. 62]